MGQSRKLFRGQVRLQQEFLCLLAPHPSVWQSYSQSPLPFRILILFWINKFLSRATDFIWFHCGVGFIFVNPEFIFFCPRTQWNRHSITESVMSKLSIATKSDPISVSFSIWSTYKSRYYTGTHRSGKGNTLAPHCPQRNGKRKKMGITWKLILFSSLFRF